jgi:3-oxoacyl-[acyl-carrier protein] reductase
LSSPDPDQSIVKNQVAIISGGGGDIARAIARSLAPQCSTIALADRDEGRLREATAELARETAIVTGLVDVRSRAAIREFVGEVIATEGRIDIMVNVAGAPAKPGLLVETSDDDWDELIESHLRGTATFCQAVFAPMQEARAGRIVNTVSAAAFLCPPGQATYAAAKAGITAMTRSLAAEAGPFDITANCVAPGFTASRRVSSNYDEEGRQAHLRDLGVVLEPRRMAETSEIAAAVRYLCSPEAAYVTGMTMHVNGGAFRP